MRTIKPPLILVLDSGQYVIPDEELQKFLRFTPEQMGAVRAMRDAGIAEDVINQAFPPQVVPPSSPVATSAVAAPQGAPVPAPGVAPVEALTTLQKLQKRCHHGTQRMNTANGDIECAICGAIIIPKTGSSVGTHSLNDLPVRDYRSPLAALG